MRKPKPKCPADRWESEARQWKTVAERLARMCADRIGCCFDEEKQCPEEVQCATCWLNRAIRETARGGRDG